MLVNMCGDIQFSEKNDYFRFRAQRRLLPFFGCFSFVAQVIRTLPLLLRFRGPHFSVALSASIFRRGPLLHLLPIGCFLKARNMQRIPPIQPPDGGFSIPLAR